jgi:trans-aconitate methyltransferase|tara:strand:+ start:48 stop:731 length:684 start_codon:yes stop_codon:yes gene_type:complete
MKTSQLHTYKNNYKLREHQKKLLNILIKKYKKNFNGTVLDIGCAQGTFLQHFKKNFPNSEVFGVDTSKELIAKSKKININKSTFYTKDFLILNEKYDLVFASGVLGYYDDQLKTINKMLSLTKKTGTLFIFSHFNTRNIDTRIRFRNNFNSNKWERGLNSFSIHTIKKHLTSKNLKFKFLKFDVPIKLKPQKNPIISYTIETKSNNKICLSGSNLRLEYYYLIIERK